VLATVVKRFGRELVSYRNTITVTKILTRSTLNRYAVRTSIAHILILPFGAAEFAYENLINPGDAWIGIVSQR